MQTSSGRWPVPPKYLLRRPDGKWRSMDSCVLDFITRAPHGCRRDNLANAVRLTARRAGRHRRPIGRLRPASSATAVSRADGRLSASKNTAAMSFGASRA